VRCLLALPLLLVCSAAAAQPDQTLQDPALTVFRPDSHRALFTNFCGPNDYPIPPYAVVDTSQSLMVGHSVFSQGVPYTFEGIRGILALVEDEGDNSGRACADVISDLTGRIAFVERGDCNFVDKVCNVQARGARGILVFNNADRPHDYIGGMSGTPPCEITIPAMLIPRALGGTLFERIREGTAVEVAMKRRFYAEYTCPRPPPLSAEPPPDPAIGLGAPHPNPFTTGTRLELAPAAAQYVRVALHDLLGRSVAVLFDGFVLAGERRQIEIDGTGLAPGVYVVRATGERFSQTYRITLLR
jgi:hypothetical protein